MALSPPFLPVLVYPTVGLCVGCCFLWITCLEGERVSPQLPGEGTSMEPGLCSSVSILMLVSWAVLILVLQPALS